MQKTYLIAGAICGLLGVVLGAFGAHVIRESVSPDTLAVYETGVRYQFYHAFALLAVGILSAWFPGKTLWAAGLLFLAGIILFSGSLYLITFMQSQGKEVSRGIGILTPVGGLLLIAGWILLLAAITGRRPA